MATSFSNSIRSLKVHDPRKTIIGLVISSVLVIAWLIWFGLAQITLYQLSDSLTINGAETVLATFPSNVNGLIESGQIAFLQLDGKVGADIGTVPGVVLEVKRKQKQNKIEANILLDWNTVKTIDFEAGLTGKIQVEIEKISPINLVMRSARSSIQTVPPENHNPANGDQAD